MAPDGTAQIIDATQSPVEGELGMGYELNSNDSAGIRSDALYSFEGWLNNLTTRASLQALGVWDRRRMRLVERRMAVGVRDLLYKLEHGYHGRALNANGPNTHYRNVCVVDVAGSELEQFDQLPRAMLTTMARVQRMPQPVEGLRPTPCLTPLCQCR